MGLENFITEAFHEPRDYVAYHVGRELVELHPGKSIIEGETGSFDLEAFVRAGKCTVVHETSLFSHIKTDWIGAGRKLKDRVENSWLNVLWRGTLIDVLFLSWAEGCYKTRHHWIIAEDRKVAEDFFREVCEWCDQVRGEVLVFEDGEWEKNQELYAAVKSATFDNLILREPLKQEIRDDFERFFASRELYERYRIPWKRGVLFTGPPGNGKTHTVKALINQLKQPCLYVKSFKCSYQTDQESMRAVFSRARQTTPCLLVMEDLDSMIDDKNRSFFLNELDGFEANTGVVAVATTNHADRLDPAIVERPSRFDRKYSFELPAEAERSRYVVAWNNDLQSDLRLSSKAIPSVVRQSDGFSFAYMKELFVSSMMQWMALNGSTSMDNIVLAQAVRLREQMSTAASAVSAQAGN